MQVVRIEACFTLLTPSNRALCRSSQFVIYCSSLRSLLQAATGGSISGTVTDQSGAVVIGAALKLVNTAQTDHLQAQSPTSRGFYTFPNLPVGHYELDITAAGFNTAAKDRPCTVDADSALRINVSLEIGTR